MPSIVPLLFLALMGAFSAYQLWTAYSRGTVRGRAGSYSRDREPIRYWATTILNALLVFVAAVLVFMWILRAAAHGVSLDPDSGFIKRSPAEQMSRDYPERARRLGVEGSALLSCTMTPDRGLKACSLLSEQPPGYGFGEAALRMAPLVKIRDAADKASAGRIVRVPIRFKLPSGPRRR